MIKFVCNACGRPLRVDDKLAGKRGRCPDCSSQLTVPELNLDVPRESIPHGLEKPAGLPTKRGPEARLHSPYWKTGALISACGLVLSVCLNAFLISVPPAFLDLHPPQRTGMFAVSADRAKPPVVNASHTTKENEQVQSPEKRMWRAVVDSTVPEKRRISLDKFFRVALCLKQKDNGQIYLNYVGYVVATDHEEGLQIAAEATRIRPEDIDVVEGRSFDDASSFTEKTIGQNILVEKHCLNLGTDVGRSTFRDVILEGNTIVTYKEFYESHQASRGLPDETHQND